MSTQIIPDTPAWISPAREKPETFLQPALRDLIRTIPSVQTRDVVGRVFVSLAQMLSLLHAGEEDLREANEAGALGSLKAVQGKAAALLDFIATGTFSSDFDTELGGALEGTCFVLAHELKRVADVLASARARGERREFKATLFQSYGLLRNCFEQSTIALAQVFDANMSGTSLFDDFDSRRRQSSELCEDLENLIEIQNEAEARGDMDTVFRFTDALKQFRDGNMRYLMYKDWEELERMMEQVFETRELESVMVILPPLGRYLETLLGHVRMRAVLRDPEPDGADAQQVSVSVNFWRRVGSQRIWVMSALVLLVLGVAVPAPWYFSSRRAADSQAEQSSGSSGAPQTDTAVSGAASVTWDTGNPAPQGQLQTGTPEDGGSNAAGEFVLQVGSHSDRSAAEVQVRALRSQGVSTRIVKVGLSQRGTWYRVQAGPFATSAEATRYGADLLNRKLVSEFLVIRGEGDK